MTQIQNMKQHGAHVYDFYSVPKSHFHVHELKRFH